ncbi:RraA-like protein [Acaromyces ingoldii]|uniref:RraA-like protein n=1 Tax=Acaromyces ingoldii TaxID=215250 RepID=A0A316YWD9_9BASI|nr:RraA-like protein [Acaromyces ingoldii]PWN93840.1 RraA-like protein [Acaromyces ingoldii]
MAAAKGTKELVSLLEKFGTCEIADALVKLKNRSGGHLPGIFAHAPRSDKAGLSTGICGPAFTVEMVSQADIDAPKPDKHFVDATEGHEGCVMVISAPPETRSAIWGGLMTLRAQALGVKGVVLDGRCRDLEEQWDSGFSIFARSHSTLGQSPFTRPSRLQVPLSIADPTAPSFPPTTVAPDDLVRADVDGVVVCPRADVLAVVEAATKAREIDERCKEDLLRGKGVKETFAKWRGK